MKKVQKITTVGSMMLALSCTAQAQVSGNVVKIGVMTDLSGSYSDLAGQGSVAATRMAIEDFIAKEKPNFKIEMVTADHQNKTDVAAGKAREWFDREGVDVVSDLVTTSVALAVMRVGKEKDRVVLPTASASSSITNENCNDVTIHYAYDTYALANGTAKALTNQGGKSWYFLTADYAFGHALEKDTSTVVTASGGKVVGSVRHPFPSSDLSSYLVKAQTSGAQVIGLANAGADTANAIKQAAEFGITPKQSLAGLLMFITDVHSLGLKNTQGMYLTTGFYWDRNEETRAWSKRFFADQKKMPTMIHAGQYSSIQHYLKAVKAAGTDDARKVVEQMKKMPVNDFFAKDGKVREDGRMVHEMYLVQVKKPSESKYPWDYFTIKATISPDEAFQPLKDSRCPLVKK
jgi:branched-chain amino acid transport system substrate-binding protein